MFVLNSSLTALVCVRESVFNTAMHFKGVKFTDQIRIELKVNRNLAENILLFQTFIRMDELLKLIAPHPVETKFEITLQDARADESGSRDPRDRDAPTAALLCCFDINPKVPPDLPDPEAHRSEERRGGKEWVSTSNYRWSPYH